MEPVLIASKMTFLIQLLKVICFLKKTPKSDGIEKNKDPIVIFTQSLAYLKAILNGKGDYNVFCLDYGLLPIHGPIPDDPVPTVRKLYEYMCETVSEKAVSLMLGIADKNNLQSLNDVHIIGHSLGGQISGYIGRKIQERTPHRIGRITGIKLTAKIQ